MIKDLKPMTNVTPLNYNLEFDVDLNNSEFIGREVIDLIFENETRTIDLNSADLKILECTLKSRKEVIQLSSQPICSKIFFRYEILYSLTLCQNFSFDVSRNREYRLSCMSLQTI